MANVKVYSTTHCPWCSRAKEFLTQNNVEFKDVNVENDVRARNEMIQQTGQMGVPVIDIDGEFIVGFQQDRIVQALGI